MSTRPGNAQGASRRPSSFRPGRVALVATIGLMAGALVLTVWFTYRGVRRASSALVRGQATSLQANLRGELRQLAGPPTTEDLEELLDAYSGDGLRYIAAVSRQEIGATAGTSAYRSLSSRALLRSLRRGEPTSLGARVRLILRAPGERPRRRRHKAKAAGPKWQAPTIYIEFVPTEALALRTSSTRSLMVGGAAAAMLLLFAGLLLRWFAKQDRLREQEESDRRLKSLGQMSAVLAHEIRNPLASLKGNAQILEKLVAKGDASKQEKSVAKAERVVHEAVRLETLVNDLLNFAKSGELKRTSADPKQLLEECALEVRSAEVSMQADSAPKQWSLDTARMKQVLGNLLGNAAQMSERVSASTFEEDGALVFQVRDYGSGLDEDNAEKLFEPFHTKKVNGTGLGLAVAKRIVELHGGTITARNAEGGGAEFTVRIPRE